MKTMTEILTIPALKADNDLRRPRRSARWTTQVGHWRGEDVEDEELDGESAAAGLSRAELIILLVK